MKLSKILSLIMAFVLTFTVLSVSPVFAFANEKITSDVYTINRQKGLIFIPRGVTSLQVKNSLNNDNSTLDITTETGKVSDNALVFTGMTISLNTDGAEALTVITIGDANLDGRLLVTDLLSTADYALNTPKIQDNSFYAMDVNHDGSITVIDVILARKYILEEKAMGYYTEGTYSMNNIDYAVIGREVVSNKGTQNECVTLQASSGGIEFLVDSEGDIKLDLQANKPQFVTAVIDGKESDINLSTKRTQVTVAKGLSKGLHTVKLYTQVEGGNVGVYGMNLIGKVLDRKEKDLTIEFIGDSITAAFGNIFQTDDGKIPYNNERHQNGFLGYASIVGRTLDANFSVIAESGSVLMHNAKDPKDNRVLTSMQDVYKTRKEPKLQDGRKIDITVVALGGNDSKALAGITTDREYRINYFKGEAKAFARAIVEENGADAKVVFMQSGGLAYAKYYGTSRPEYFTSIVSSKLIQEAYKRAVEELADEGIKAYLVPDLPCDLRGLYVHPLVEGEGGHKDIANRLVTYLKENVIND